MTSLVAYSINNENFTLSAERVLFWEKEKTLVIADMHLGKTGHFRKSGIPVPQRIYMEDLQRLFTQILYFKAEQLLIVGDLTHSNSNKELEIFRKWRSDVAALNIRLVKGNHDILDEQWYHDAGIITTHDPLLVGKFLFVHDITSCELPSVNYIFSGHLHPGISVKGIARQSLRFPCFYFSNHYCVLPAFSRFTGTSSIAPKKGEHVFALVEKKIIQVHG